MFGLSKIAWYAVGVLLIVTVSLGLLLRQSYVANGALSARAEGAEQALGEAVKQRKLDAALLTRRQSEIASERRKSAQANAALQTALQASPEWAGTSVPPEVQSALTEAVEGLE